ncbi:glycoside hydrolase family 16 protein [Pseudarthrobacter sp. B907]|uniref:glycoside hydrolase family 16 protein n=1 Tax=Pseudarthrobacter sp. B907 TaxID=3158261 RepID=UPI0032DB01D2
MFKKIAITVTLGALSLTGCSAASSAGTAAPTKAVSPTSSARAASPTSAPATSAAAPAPAETTAAAPAAPPAAAAAAPNTPPAVPAAASAVPAAPAVALAPAAPAGDGAQAAAALGWGPVLAGDEFSYAGAPDATKWGVFNGAGHAGKGVRSPQAWSVANGVATVTGDAAGTTGGMSAKFGQQKYGRWETRMKTNARDSEYHPVLLLWPNNNTSPNCAEVDFAEGTSNTASMKFFLHYACSGGDFQTTAATPVDTTQWHNYAVEWTPTGITGYIDGVKTFSDTNPAHQPTVGMHQTMQLDWFPDGTATSPSQMQVDWVRVYQ